MEYSKQVKEDALAVHIYLRDYGWRNDCATPPNGSRCVIWAQERTCGHNAARDDAFFRAFSKEAGCSYMDVGEWNDAPGRTFGEVEEVLQRIYNS